MSDKTLLASIVRPPTIVDLQGSPRHQKAARWLSQTVMGGSERPCEPRSSTLGRWVDYTTEPQSTAHFPWIAQVLTSRTSSLSTDSSLALCAVKS